MSKRNLIIIAIAAVLAGGGVIYLLSLDIPPPVQHVDKELPDERFPQ